ncbi:uncharacterized protein LOC118152148 [Callithrix jacchus]
MTKALSIGLDINDLTEEIIKPIDLHYYEAMEATGSFLGLRPLPGSGRKVSAFDIGTASPSWSSLNPSSRAPLGMTHLNSSSTPSGASVPAAGLPRNQGTPSPGTTPVRREGQEPSARSCASSGSEPGNPAGMRRLQMSAASSQQVEAPSSERGPLKSERSAPQARPFPPRRSRPTRLMLPFFSGPGTNPQNSRRHLKVGICQSPFLVEGMEAETPKSVRGLEAGEGAARTSGRRRGAAPPTGRPRPAPRCWSCAEMPLASATSGSPQPGAREGRAGRPAGVGTVARPPDAAHTDPGARRRRRASVTLSGKRRLPACAGPLSPRLGFSGQSGTDSCAGAPSSHPKGARPEIPEEKSPAARGCPGDSSMLPAGARHAGARRLREAEATRGWAGPAKRVFPGQRVLPFGPGRGWGGRRKRIRSEAELRLRVLRQRLLENTLETHGSAIHGAPVGI